MRSILDDSFRYTPSVQTDLKKTFARIRREQRQQDQAQARAVAEVKLKVAPIRYSETAGTMSTRVYSKKA